MATILIATLRIDFYKTKLPQTFTANCSPSPPEHTILIIPLSIQIKIPFQKAIEKLRFY